MSAAQFHGKLALQQRVLTTYRAAFFDALAEACTGGLEVAAGEPRAVESIAVTAELQRARFTALTNIHILSGRLYACQQVGLLDWLQRADPDALIVEANPRYLATRQAAGWMRRRGKAVLGWGLGASGGLGAGLRRNFIRQFDALLTYSQRGAKEYAALGYPERRIFVAPNAAAHRPTGAAWVRPELQDGRATALFVGRLQKRKRVDLLLAACAALPKALQPRLIVVGDGPEMGALRALAAQIYPAAEFTGARHGEALVPIFRSADLFVLPGTGGLAVQEAMSHALPVIMGKGDGTNADLVRPGNGWQVREDDLGSLTQALQEALADGARLRRMGLESFRIVREEINLEAMVGVFVRALEAARSGG